MADSVGTVQTFVKDNRKLLVEDVERLTRTVKTLASERGSIDGQVLDSAAVASATSTWPATPRPTPSARASASAEHLGPRRPALRAGQELRAARRDQGPRLHHPRDAARAARGQGAGDPAGERASRPDRSEGPGRAGTSRRRGPPARPSTARPGAVRRRPRLRVCSGVAREARSRPPVRGALGTVLLLTGCEFDGAYDLPLPGSPVDADHSYEITADFNDILSVVPTSPVMVDDVTVGEVTEVERVGWHARVTLRVRDDVKLPDNAVAEVKQVSLLGEKYIALEDPAGAEPTGQLSDGDHITLDETARSPEVEEVLGALSMLLSGGGVGQLSTIFDELNQLMDGRTDKLRSVLTNLRDVVGTLDDQKGDILRALEAVNNLTATLNAEKQTDHRRARRDRAGHRRAPLASTRT